ncbi:MAG: cation diffusion facilitator family transporter [Candidatus Anammoxibacter sp.]
MAAKQRKKNDCGSYNDNCPKCLNGVGYIGLTLNVFLVLMKVGVGISFFSIVLLTDSLYSILDIGFAILIIVGLKISSKPPDSDHDYGHGKVEFVITLAFAVLATIGAVVLFVLAIHDIRSGEVVTYSHYVLVAALISTLANYIFYQYSRCVSKQFFSPSIKSLSIHSHADCLSSAMVAVSMLIAYAGYEHAGLFVAIIETIHILFISIKIFKEALYGLLDAAIPDEDLDGIKKILNSMPKVKNVSSVKSRKVGQRVWLNIGIEVDPSLDIDEVDSIKKNIYKEIRGLIKNLQEVMLSVEPFKEDEDEDSVMRAANA